MKAASSTELVSTLSQLTFIDRIWLYGSRRSESRSDGARISIAIDCPTATLFDWQQIRAIVAKACGAMPVECIRWDTLDASAPVRRRILDDRVLVHMVAVHG
jgi:hypothetical protein